MHFLIRKLISSEEFFHMVQSFLGGVDWRIKGLRIWIGIYFLIRKLSSFEGSSIWPKALGGGGWRVKGPWIWTGMYFLRRKLTSFEGSCIWPKVFWGRWAGGSKACGFG